MAFYDAITTENGEFEASALHNIAVADQNGKISFEFARDLQEGDQLVGFEGESIKVRMVKSG